MNTKYYDVVVLGTDPAPLLAAALLGKQGFRVLVVGHGSTPPDYTALGRRWPRAPFAFTPANSPATQRIFHQLGLAPLLSRYGHRPRPAFQVAMPGHRLDIHADAEPRQSEMVREFPDVVRVIEDFHAQASSHATAFDDVLQHTGSWPPTGWLARRALRNAVARTALATHSDAQDALLDFPSDHPFRAVVELPARFSTATATPNLNALSRERLYAQWCNDALSLDGGAARLHNALLGRLNAFSAEVLPRTDVRALHIKRKRIRGVQLSDRDGIIGCDFVVAGTSLESLLRLLPSRTLFDPIFDTYGQPRPSHYRYTLNVLVHSRAIPESLGTHMFFMRNHNAAPEGDNVLHIERVTQPDPETTLLCVQALVPAAAVERDSDYLTDLRPQLLRALEHLLPFYRDHVLAYDSPHDGLPIIDVSRDEAITPSDPRQRGPLTMDRIDQFPVLHGQGQCALPVQTPLAGLLLCHTQAVPGLGLEGEMLAAETAAHHIARQKHRKAWMRRGIWNA